MPRPVLLAALLTAPLLVGCLGADAGPATPSENAAPPSPSTTPSSEAFGPWPRPEDALLRPGVQWGDSRSGVVGVYESEGVVALCTANFVFRSPDNASLFLGTAAHCTDELAIGDPVAFAFGKATGVLYYDAWKVLDERGARDARTERDHDFALLRVDDAFRHLVHPAMYHFGGPTDVAAVDDVGMGDQVLSYGNSSLHAGQEPLRRNEGCVTGIHDGTANLRTLHPVVAGDSGSPVVMEDGRALGLTSRVGRIGDDVPRGNIVATLLSPNLALARSEGVDVELVPWPLLGSGVSPVQLCV